MSRQLPPIRGDQDFADCSSGQLFNFFADYKTSFRETHPHLKPNYSNMVGAFVEEHLQPKIFIRKDSLAILAEFLFHVNERSKKSYESFYEEFSKAKNIDQDGLVAAIEKFDEEQKRLAATRQSSSEDEELPEFKDDIYFWREEAAKRPNIKKPNPELTTTSNEALFASNSHERII